jgi:hypothetical protein
VDAGPHPRRLRPGRDGPGGRFTLRSAPGAGTRILAKDCTTQRLRATLEAAVALAAGRAGQR